MNVYVIDAKGLGMVYVTSVEMFRVGYTETLLEDRFKEPMRIISFMNSLASTLVGVGTNEGQFSAFLPVLEQSVFITAPLSILPEGGSVVEIHPEDQEEPLEVEISFKDGSFIVEFDGVYINSSEIFNERIYWVNGVRKKAYMHPSLIGLGEEITSCWMTLFTLTVSYVLFLEGYDVTQNFLFQVRSSFSELKHIS